MRSLVLFFLLVFCFVGYGQIIYFPDANFKNALVNTKCVDTNSDNIGDADADVNNDGEIEVAEANLVRSLFIERNKIKSLIGIEDLKNLTYLHGAYNEIIDVDFTKNHQIVYINLFDNLLTNLKVNNLINLETISCGMNSLDSIDLKGCNNLFQLICNDNNLRHIEVNHLTKLRILLLGNNQLLNLDVENLENLSSW